MNKITKDNFETAINSNKNVIIDFSASWCKPCEALKPILEEIKSKREDISVFSIDIEEEIELTDQFKIRNVPVLLYYRFGKLIAKTVGSQTINDILSKFDK